eukprot:TRINITY_DN5740_c0_g2_i2.p1 TRINITY_DN5740_c0_g2~~TRINITY_DN5740_c0_g2_i2.p1  ORF type:complete len:822 (+),score=142.44 TRINITY_DN5740_c0_g2_i2:142-2607(+)
MEIRKAPTARLLSFLSELSCGSAVCNRIRLIFVGQEGAGKTTLIKVISSKEMKVKEKFPSTDGIEVSDWTSEDLTFHCWDFGGQELFYPSHQYFLSSSSIYIATFNLEEESSTQRLDYWLKTVYTLSPTSPVIVVGTHCDSKKCTEKSIAKTFATLSQKYERYKQILGYFPVSSLKGQGIKKFKLKLMEVARGCDLVVSKLPRSYLMLEEWIETSKEMYHPPIISWSAFEKIAAKSGVHSKNLVAATEFLMTMGVLLHFNKAEDPNNVGLSDNVILDANWLTKVMNSIVSFSHSFGKKDGLLKPEELLHIWRPPEYPADLHPTLIAMLEKFEVLFRLKRQEGEQAPYLIPSLLPIPEPEEVIRKVWHSADPTYTTLSRQYECEFLPLGFFGRCIVRLIQFTEPIAYWRSGVLSSFGRRQQKLIFVRIVNESDSSVKLIIQVKGHNPSNVMHSVLECIDKLIDFWYGNLVSTIVRKTLCPHCVQQKMNVPTTFSIKQLYDSLLAGDVSVKCGTIGLPVTCFIPDLFLANPPLIKYSDIQFENTKKKLGEGAFSVVTLGKLNGKTVAVKELKFDEMDDKHETFRQFVLESFYLCTSSHPCIVSLEGICFQPLCMILECVPHGTLYDVIHSKFEMTDHIRLKIAENIASAVNRLHSIKPPIIHRDLKTPNILVSSLDVNSNVLVKLADLGLSCRATSEVKRDRDLTNLDWMAPEVMRQQPFTEKADVFSFGIILWELISAQHPYEEFKFNFMVQKEDSIAGGIRPTIPLRCPANYSKLISDCWNHDPALRPSFLEILGKLSKMLREFSTPERSFLGSHKSPRVI